MRHETRCVCGSAVYHICQKFVLPPSPAPRPVVTSLCRQAVPLAVALLNVSAPKLGAMDMLSRLSHDTDLSVAQNAVVALGELCTLGLPQLLL